MDNESFSKLLQQYCTTLKTLDLFVKANGINYDHPVVIARMAELVDQEFDIDVDIDSIIADDLNESSNNMQV